MKKQSKKVYGVFISLDFELREPKALEWNKEYQVYEDEYGRFVYDTQFTEVDDGVFFASTNLNVAMEVYTAAKLTLGLAASKFRKFARY